MHTRTHLFSAFVFALALPGAALANPGMAGGGMGEGGGMGRGAEASFARMDADKDGKVTPEEFAAAYPQMKEAAFTSIDTNGDKVISKEEWMAFAKGHAADEAATHPEGAMPGMGGMPPGMGGMGGMPPGMGGNGTQKMPGMGGTNGTAPAQKGPELIMPPKQPSK